jgi:hypothetical protein
MAREKQLVTHMPTYYSGYIGLCLDDSTELGRAFKDRLAALLDALGGEEKQSIVQLSEARDYVTLELLIEAMVSGLLRREPADLGQLISAMNCRTNKGRTLSGWIEKLPRRRLRDVMNGSSVTPIIKPTWVSP